jgi:thioredoxin reductase
MKNNNNFDVIIIGGSYAGLAAGMALGRALKNVLIIDGGKPCNRQTPFSHNFLTQDGKKPDEIAKLAKLQVENYKTVKFLNGIAIKGEKTTEGFEIETDKGETFEAKKLIFAAGIKEIHPNIQGFAECWGISVLHCPYCHGYEIRNEVTGILGNGDVGFEFAKLISNWTKELNLFTNGKSTLTIEQTAKLAKHKIRINENEIAKFEHINGYIQNITFKNGTQFPLKAVYAISPFEQQCTIAQNLGCELTDEGYIKIDSSQKTSVYGIYACGDNATRLRTLANAVTMGTTAGMMLNKEIVLEAF